MPSLTMRLACLALALLASPAFGQSVVEDQLPDWAAPSPQPPTAASSTPPGGPGGTPGTPEAPSPVPLDGGLGLLALAGGAYDAKRLRERSAD